MNVMSTVALFGSILGILLVVNGTFNHGYVEPASQTLEQQAINISDIKNLKGEIVSIQNNASNQPEWIVTGRWKLFQTSADSPSSSNTSSDNLQFNASITMERIDGTETHRHRLTDFNFSNIALQNRSVIINGTVSLVTLGDTKENLSNNITAIPITLKIMNLETMSIELNSKVTREHFGNSPIYAKVG